MGQPSYISCSHAYHSLISDCTTWALNTRHSISSDRRKWLTTSPQPKRSNWMYHAVYKFTGQGCQSSHLSHLNKTLNELSNLSINDSVVYLFKIAGHLNIRLNILPRKLCVVNEMSDWNKQVGAVLTKVKWQKGLTMEFLSKYTVFAVFLKLLEIQDTWNQIWVVALEILSPNNSRVAANLTPLKFNLSTTCYTDLEHSQT